MKMNAITMGNYINKMKILIDNLATAGNFFTKDDLISYILLGLGTEYDPVVVNITTIIDDLSMTEAFSLLVNHESQMKQLSVATNLKSEGSFSTNFARASFHWKKVRGRRSMSRSFRGNGQGKDRGRNKFGSRGNRLTC